MSNAIDQNIAVNVSQIKVGDVIKNYPAMCLRLGEGERAGKPRERQITNWKRYFKFEKIGHKYVITKVEKEPIPKVDLRSDGNNSSYSKYTPLLLIDWLIRYVIDEMNTI